jgi:hypothetical protein
MSDKNAPAWMQDVAQAGGWNQHHLQNLSQELELRKKELELFKEINKVQPEQWQNIRFSVQGLNEFVKAGGNTEIINSFVDQVKQTITNNIGDALSPLTNEINAQMNIIMAPINSLLSGIANQLTGFLSDAPIGAGVGGIVGSALGTFWAGPMGAQAGQMIGAIVGTYVEKGIENAFSKEKLTSEPNPMLDPFGWLLKPFSILLGAMWIAFFHTLPPWLATGGGGGGSNTDAGAHDTPGDVYEEPPRHGGQILQW